MRIVLRENHTAQERLAVDTAKSTWTIVLFFGGIIASGLVFGEAGVILIILAILLAFLAWGLACVTERGLRAAFRVERS